MVFFSEKKVVSHTTIGAQLTVLSMTISPLLVVNHVIDEHTNSNLLYTVEAYTS